MAPLGDFLSGRCPYRRGEERVTVFSPFGLGILDLPVADLARRRAETMAIGTCLPVFLSTAGLHASS